MCYRYTHIRYSDVIAIYVLYNPSFIMAHYHSSSKTDTCSLTCSLISSLMCQTHGAKQMFHTIFTLIPDLPSGTENVFDTLISSLPNGYAKPTQVTQQTHTLPLPITHDTTPTSPVSPSRPNDISGFSLSIIIGPSPFRGAPSRALEA